MPTQTRPHRSALAFLLILVLVAVGSPIVAARSTASGAAKATAAIVAPRTTPADAASGVGAAQQFDHGPDDLRRHVRQPNVSAGQRAVATDVVQAAWISRPTPAVPQPTPRTQSRDAELTAGGPPATGGDTAYRGRNHVWIPALGIDRSISFFSCSSSAYPGDRVYRWGCAGGNNVYLFGHAHSVFKPLHDAYVRGRLKKGMKLIYADGDGRISTYRVAWWKITTPDNGEFAYASQPEPSVTLQTCVGAKSQFRLIVRLSKVD